MMSLNQQSVADVQDGFSPSVLAGGQAPAQTRTRCRRPHICFVALLAWPVLTADPRIPVMGGAEVQQCLLARMLVRAGYQVSMICLDFGQPDRTVVDGITVYRAYGLSDGLPVVRFVYPRMTSLWKAMRQADADIYYQRSAAMVTALVAAFCRRYHRHSIYAAASDNDFSPGHQEIRWWRDRRLFELGLAAVDAVVVQNERQRADCMLHYGRPATLIPGCYELPATASPGRGEFVLWVATLRPDKRPELFVELARRLPAYRFVLVGGPSDDPGGAACHARLLALAAGVSNLELTGFLPLAETERYFDRARLLINTSSVEGMPNTFFQAWARGIPVIAFSDVGARLKGVPVYPVASCVDEAVAEAERLLTDPQAYAEAGARGRRYFQQRHASPAVLEQFVAVMNRWRMGEA